MRSPATPKKKGSKRKAKADTASKDQVTSEEALFHLEEQFFPGLVDRFLRTLETIDVSTSSASCLAFLA